MPGFPGIAVMGSGLPLWMELFNERMVQLPGRGGAGRSLSCASSRSWQPPSAIPLPASGSGGYACCGANPRGRDAGYDRSLFRVSGCCSLSCPGLLAAKRNGSIFRSHFRAVRVFHRISDGTSGWGEESCGESGPQEYLPVRNAGTYGYGTSVPDPAISGTNTLITRSFSTALIFVKSSG